MQKSKNTPPFLRYFSARFQPFTRPIFWVSLGTVFIAGAAIYQYWQHPEFLETTAEDSPNSSFANGNSLTNSTTQNQERSDNLGTVNLLLDELEQNKTLANISSENRENSSSPLKKEESSFSRLQQEQKAQATKPTQSITDTTEANPYSVVIGTGKNKTIELLKPSSFNKNQSSDNFYTRGSGNNNSIRNDIIPNPVGNNYLSNRQRLPLANVTLDSPVTGEATNNSNSIPTINNNSVSNSPEFNSPNQSLNSNLGDETIPYNQPATTRVPNLPLSASSAISSLQTPAAPIVNSAAPSTTISPNPANSSSNLSGNPYGASGNPVNGLPNNNANSLSNSPNGVMNSELNTFAQPTPRSFVPGVTTGLNQIRRETFGNTLAEEEDPNSLQNNYRNSQLIAPNYNRSAPSGYQLQPRNFSQNNIGQSNTLDRTNGGESITLDSNSANINSPITRPMGTPTLQPSGFFSTSELQR